MRQYSQFNIPSPKNLNFTNLEIIKLFERMVRDVFTTLPKIQDKTWIFGKFLHKRLMISQARILHDLLKTLIGLKIERP